MAKMNNITLYWKGENYCTYDDEDVATDYFNGYRLSTKNTIEWIKEDGADIILVDVVNNDSEIPIYRRLKRICKACGYAMKDNSHPQKSPMTGKVWFEYQFKLNKAS